MLREYNYRYLSIVMSSQLLSLSSDALISSTQNQISSELAGEAVILHLSSGVYYGLNEVGARVWELVQQPRQFDELHRILMEEYDVASEDCEQDLTKIISELKAACLVEVSDETT